MWGCETCFEGCFALNRQGSGVGNAARKDGERLGDQGFED